MEDDMYNLFIQIGISLLFIFSVVFSQDLKKSELNLMPVPKSVEIQKGKFRLNNDFTISKGKEKALGRSQEGLIYFENE